MEFVIQQVASTDKKLIQQVGETLRFLKKDYPDFSNWYSAKVVPNLKSSQRKIFVAYSDSERTCIAGILILKDSPHEKKICSLFVGEQYRAKKLATDFLSLAVDELGTVRPVITVSSERHSAFKKLFQKFGFVLYDTYPEYYKNGASEISYNGPIESFSLKKATNA